MTPLGRPSFEQTTYNIQVAKTPWQYLGHKSHCWKAHFFKICFFVKYFRQQLLSLVNMGLHAAIIRLSPLIHEREQQYKQYIVSDARMVSLLWPPFEKSWLRPCSWATILIVWRSLTHPPPLEKLIYNNYWCWGNGFWFLLLDVNTSRGENVVECTELLGYLFKLLVPQPVSCNYCEHIFVCCFVQ